MINWPRLPALGDLVDHGFEFCDGLREAVVQRGIIDELADRTFAAFDEGHDAVGALSSASMFCSALWLERTTSLNWVHLRGDRVSVLCYWADGCELSMSR